MDGDVYIPLKDLLPMVDPNDLTIDGWDISSLDLIQSMERAEVLDWNLQQKLKPYMKDMKPRRSIYCPDFIAANQADRADNILSGMSFMGGSDFLLSTAFFLTPVFKIVVQKDVN